MYEAILDMISVGQDSQDEEDFDPVNLVNPVERIRHRSYELKQLAMFPHHLTARMPAARISSASASFSRPVFR